MPSYRSLNTAAGRRRLAEQLWPIGCDQCR